MRSLIIIIYFLAVGSSLAQNVVPYNKEEKKKWTYGKVYFSNGQTVEADLRLLVSFNEGSFQL